MGTARFRVFDMNENEVFDSGPLPVSEENTGVTGLEQLIPGRTYRVDADGIGVDTEIWIGGFRLNIRELGEFLAES